MMVVPVRPLSIIVVCAATACATEIPNADEFACGGGGPCGDAAVAPPDATALPDTGIGPIDGGDIEHDTGVSSDSGGSPADTGVSSDSGVSPADTGVSSDSGVSPADTGVSSDSGVSPADTGVSLDSGVSPADTGVLDPAPTVSFVRPANLSTVTGEVDVLVSAMDNGSIASVEIRHESQALSVTDLGGGLYGATWSSCGLANTRALIASATDDLGQSSEVTVLVTPSNPLQPPAPTLDAYPAAVSASTIQLAGTKQSSASLVLNGSVIIGPGPTAWTHTVSLNHGANSWVFDTTEVCWSSSGAPVTVEIVRDEVRPTLDVTSPSAGQTVSGVVAIEATAMDNDQVAAIWVDVDGTQHAMSGSDTLATTWSTVGLADGMHQLTFGARDRAGNFIVEVVNVQTSNLPAGALLVSVEPSVSAGNVANARSTAPSAAVSSQGYRVVAWRDNADVLSSGSDDDILLRDYDRSLNLRAETVVSDSAADGRSLQPALAASTGGLTHIVWQDDGDHDSDGNVDWDIVYRSWNGTGLGSIVVLSNHAEDGVSQFARVADDDGTAHVVWQDDGDADGDMSPDKDVYYVTGSGTTFSAIQVVSPSTADSSRPAIAISTADGCPHVVWQEYASLVGTDMDLGDPDIYYRSSSGTGCTWGVPILVSGSSLLSLALRPVIAADATTGGVWVAFEASEVGQPDRRVYARSIVSGTLGPLFMVNDGLSAGLGQQASIAVDGTGIVRVAWTDDGNLGGTGTDFDVFMRSRSPGGVFGMIEPLSDSMGNLQTEASSTPAITIDGATTVAVWQDSNDYDGDGADDEDIVLLER